MTQNEHRYAICCRLEAYDDVISRRNMITIQGYVMVNFKGASFTTFRYFSQRSFCDGKISQ